MSSPKLFVVAGIGGGAGTGAASARLFAKQGYKVALIARGGDSLNKLAEDINSNGGEVIFSIYFREYTLLMIYSHSSGKSLSHLRLSTQFCLVCF